MTVDTNKTADLAKQSKSWLPVANLLKHHDIPLLIATNETKFDKTYIVLEKEYKQDPTNARVIRSDSVFSIAKEVEGYSLRSNSTKSQILTALGVGEKTVELNPIILLPTTKAADIAPRLAILLAEQAVSIQLQYQDKTKKFSPQEIANWYEQDVDGFVLSDEKIATAISSSGTGFGIGVQNSFQAVAAIKTTLQNKKALTFMLIAKPKGQKTYYYCTASRGVYASYLSGLEAKLSSVFADSRGWGLDGRVSFVKVSTGCSMTVWLTAASQMPTFGAICDSDWSCTVSPNVILNFDRWQGASSAWNSAGGSLDDYRSMVINHEVGHWFGFGHAFCGGAGQPAPVMQQQSISLAGCAFNPWPKANETLNLKSNLGL